MTAPNGPSQPARNSELIAHIRGQFADRLTSVLRAAGFSSRAGFEALGRTIDQIFAEVTATDSRTSFELLNSLTLSQIRLVDDSQLALSLRLGDLSRRLADECASGLYKFHQRFVTLADRPQLRATDNPVSPESISRALVEMFAALGEYGPSTLARIAEVETQLLKELPLLYAELAQFLTHQQVAAAQALPGGSQAERKRLGGSARSEDPVATFRQAVLAGMSPAGGATAGIQSTHAPMADATSAAFGAAILEQVIGQLSQRQQQTAAAPAHVINLLDTLRAGEFVAQLRMQEAAALDVLAAVFDAIFSDPRLGSAVKTALARLQIPVLKAAMLDASFFADRHHPARQLLEAFGRAAVGLGPQVADDDPACLELTRIAATVQAEFDRDLEVFARYSTELDTFLAQREHRLQEESQGFIALARLQEERDLAWRGAHQALRQHALAEAPAAIGGFLRETWVRVLMQDWLEGGEDGEAWHRDDAVIDDLLWSIRPKTDADERRLMAETIPALLTRLREGLDRIGVAQEARADFLNACLVHQTAALRGRSSADTAADAGNPRGSGGGDHVTLLNGEGLEVRLVRPAIPDLGQTGTLVRELLIGDWVDFPLPDGERCCGRLCWVSPTLGNPLFMHPDWHHAISVDRTILERRLASGDASVLTIVSFFDNAAEKALQRRARPDRAAPQVS